MSLSPRQKVTAAVVIVAALVAAGIAYAVVIAPPPPATGKPTVISTFYPYHFVVKTVGGDRVAASTMIPAGIEPHDWEPTPADLVRLNGASAFVFNGYLETWVPGALAGLPPARPLRVNASAGIAANSTDNGEVDPHLWVDPVRMQQIVTTVEAALVQVDPAGATEFHARAEALRANLTALDAHFRLGLSNCTLHTIITAHDAFGYLSARYGLTNVGIQGLSPDVEPSSAKIAELVELVNQTHVRYVFFEELVDPTVAQTLASEAHVQTLPLSPIEGLSPSEVAAGDSYLTLMEHNIVNLKTALGCT